MKQSLIVLLLAAALPFAASAQTATKPGAKPAAKPAAKTAAKPAASKLAPAAQKAVEEATPLEEPDPNIKLSEADLEVAKKIHVGEIPCELGATVKITPLKRDGFFLVATKMHRFRMHPVESRTGAIRLEDPARGAMWLQLGNKSMLMNQRLGQRLADECQSPDQVTFAESMKGKPPLNLFEPAPAAAPAAAAAATGSPPATPMPAADTPAAAPTVAPLEPGPPQSAPVPGRATQ